MQTKQIVQANANVIRVTKISPGDVYKRFEESSYSNSTFYGIVKNVHNDGENTVIEALEFKKSYSSLDINYKIFTNNTEDLAIFPATLEEMQIEVDGIEEKKKKEIKDKYEEIKKLEAEIDDVRKIRSGELMQGLKEMSYKELGQAEYDQKKLEASQL